MNNVRYVLDTNVIISALLFEGSKPDLALKFVLQNGSILLDRGILIEVVDVVKECRDPKDDKILELSLSGKADLIISGDKDLLVLNPFRSIEILSVEQFLKRNNTPCI